MENKKRLIDANALMKWIEECTDEKDWLVSQYNADWIWSMLDSAPTVNAVEVVHGRWRFCGSDRWNDAYVCSECGKMAMDDSNYCPNCGAKMDGDGNVH